MTLTRAQAKVLLEEHGLRPKRKLGQNFVVDANTVRRIVRLAEVRPGDKVLEIGAGLGSLTDSLVEAGAEVVALEIDPELVDILSSRPELSGVEVVHGDALEVDFDDLAPAQGSAWSVVANLPYNVATPVTLRVLERATQITRLTVMVQLEVAERLAAGPDHAAYGAASVRVAYHAHAKIVGKIPPTVFLPQPSVDSALVSIVRRDAPPFDDSEATEGETFAIVRQAFSQRRKMLRRSLAGVVAPEAFERAGVSPMARPEELAVSDFGRLAHEAR